MRYRIWESRNYVLLPTFLFTMFDITLTNFDVLHIIIFSVCSVWEQTVFKEEGIEMAMAKINYKYLFRYLFPSYVLISFRSWMIDVTNFILHYSVNRQSYPNNWDMFNLCIFLRSLTCRHPLHFFMFILLSVIIISSYLIPYSCWYIPLTYFVISPQIKILVLFTFSQWFDTLWQSILLDAIGELF